MTDELLQPEAVAGGADHRVRFDRRPILEVNELLAERVDFLDYLESLRFQGSDEAIIDRQRDAVFPLTRHRTLGGDWYAEFREIAQYQTAHQRNIQILQSYRKPSQPGDNQLGGQAQGVLRCDIRAVPDRDPGRRDIDISQVITLHVTQSAISHQVKSLEEFLGIVLFRRTSRGVALTPNGASYLARVSEVLDHLASATHDIRDRHVAGTLYVRSTPAFASRWLVPRLNDFNRRYPDIELHISTSLEPANFVDDGVNVDIRFGIVASCDLHVEPFLESSRFPVASPGLIAGGPPLRRPRDLRSYVLLHNEIEDAWPQWFACAGVEHVEPDPGPRFEHCNLTLRAASEGQGIALAYSALVTEDLSAGRLVRLFRIRLPATVIYSLVCPRNSLKHPRVTAFRNWLTTAAEPDAIRTAPARLAKAVG